MFPAVDAGVTNRNDYSCIPFKYPTARPWSSSLARFTDTAKWNVVIVNICDYTCDCPAGDCPPFECSLWKMNRPWARPPSSKPCFIFFGLTKYVFVQERPQRNDDENSLYSFRSNPNDTFVVMQHQKPTNYYPTPFKRWSGSLVIKCTKTFSQSRSFL